MLGESTGITTTAFDPSSFRKLNFLVRVSDIARNFLAEGDVFRNDVNRWKWLLILVLA